MGFLPASHHCRMNMLSSSGTEGSPDGYTLQTHLLGVHGSAEDLEAAVQHQLLRDVTEEEAELSQDVLLLLLQAEALLLRQLPGRRRRRHRKDLHGLSH